MNPSLHVAAWIALAGTCIACQRDAAKPSTATRPLAKVVVLPSAGQGKPAVDVLRKGQSDWRKEGDLVSVFAGDKVRTGKHDVALVRMDHGAEVGLDSGGVVEVTAQALVKLERGEVWLNAKAPITVATAQGTAIAKSGMGTLGFSDGSLLVSWVSGSVRLEGKGEPLVLGAGEQGRIDAAGVKRSHIKNPASLFAWTDRVRRAVSAAADDSSLVRPPRLAGLGTLSAKVPGSSQPLPFHILAEDVLVRIHDNMAVTRVEQVFRNPTNRVVEAEYRFPIPESAVLTGYDMEINGRMVKGEIVERERGRKILKKVIDEYLWRIRDPALTEWESGSTFKTRIFPIKPHEQKRIVLEHLQPLSGAAGEYRYVLPLAMGATDSPTIPKFRIQATVASSAGAPKVSVPVYAARTTPADGNQVRVEYEADAFKPLVDFAMTISAPSDKDAALATYSRGAAAGQTAADLALTDLNTFVRHAEDDTFLLRLSPSFPAGSAAAGADWLFLVDTSASRFGPDMEVQKAMVGTLLDTLGPEDRVKLMAFDTFPVLMDPAWAPPVPALKQRSREFLSRIKPGGASNLGDALRAARKEADSARPLKVLLLGDGVTTLGETVPAVLAELAGRLFDHPHSVSTLAIGSSVDRLLLTALTQRTHGRSFAVSTGEDLFPAALRVVLGLRAPVLESPKLSFTGVTVREVLPAALPNLPSGADLLVAGHYHGAGPLTATLSGTLAGKPWSRQWTFALGPARTGNTFVPLVYAAQKLDALALDNSQAAEREMVTLSKKYGIATRLTSFIVLESAAMYREFKVERSERVAWDGDAEIDYASQDETLEEGTALAADASTGQEQEPQRLRAAPPSAAGASAGAASQRTAMAKVAPPPRPATPAASPPPPVTAERKAKGEQLARRDVLLPEDAAKPTKRLAVDSWDEGGGRRGLYRGPHWQVTVRRLAAAPSPSALDRARGLAAAVQSAPTDRRARKALVDALLSGSLLDEAGRALAEWAALDRSNPDVHLLAGDLLRLQGDIEGALRAYASVLDLRPENTRVLGFLADYYEARDRWQAAHPFRISLATLRAKDASAQVALAVTALKAGRIDDAVRSAADLTEPDRGGYPALRRGVRLSKADRDTVLSIRSRQSLPLLFGSSLAVALKSAGLRVTLTWDRPANLDLWMSSNRDRYLGGTLGRTRLLTSASGQEKLFFVGGSAKGRYRAQVLCADGQGCDGVSGRLVIESHGERRTLPFALAGTRGRDLATIRIEDRSIYYRRVLDRR